MSKTKSFEYSTDETNKLSIFNDDLVAEADRICRERLGNVDIHTLPRVNEVSVQHIVDQYLSSTSSSLLLNRSDADMNLKEKIQTLESMLEIKNKEIHEYKPSS